MSTSQPGLKVDLHVHSPASIDYLGTRTARGYAELVRAYADAGVDAIAITDHNTINGYLEYRKQASQTREAYKLMSARDESSAIVAELKREVDRFDRLHVFPGVEVTVYPNIHVILIFEESVVEGVSDFLRSELHLGDAVDSGDPKKCSKQSVVTLLDLAQVRFGSNFLCVLPHVESSKGAWQELEGSARVDLFKDSRVQAAQFSNPDTVVHISKLLESGAYKRPTNLCFIQASDYHGAPNIEPASQYSDIRFDGQLCFDSLKQALSDPARVRCSHEFVEEKLTHFLRDRPQLTFDFTNKLEIDASRRKDLLKSLCAVLNTPRGVMRFNLFNVAEATNRGAEMMADLIRELIKEMDPPDSIRFGISQFHLSTARQRYCITIPQSSRVRLVDHICWKIENSLLIPATASEIEQIVARDYFERYGRSKQQELTGASKRIIGVSNAFPAMPMAARLDRLLARKRLGEFEIRIVPPNYSASLEDKNAPSNGFVDGDFILLSPSNALKGGRLHEQNDYFRFSPPTFYNGVLKAEAGEKVGPNAVVLLPNGGVLVALKDLPFFAPFPCWVLTLNKDQALPAPSEAEVLLGLAAWLKSNFVLWYITSVLQTNDLSEVSATGLRVPLPTDLDFLRQLSTHVSSIILAEQTVLTATAKVDPIKSERKRLGEILSEHNSNVTKNMWLIEREICRHLCFSDLEIREIYRALRSLDLYDYGISTRLEDFVKEVTK